MEQSTHPFVSPELMAYLERTFPDTLPDYRSVTDRDVVALMGEQRVIRKLRSLFDKQDPLSTK